MAEIHQRDGEVIRAPIYESVNPPVPYDADPSTHTASMVIKATRYTPEPTPVVGTISAPDANGLRWATFTVPTSATATHGRKWLHAWVTPAGGDPKTIAAEDLDVLPT